MNATPQPVHHSCEPELKAAVFPGLVDIHLLHRVSKLRMLPQPSHISLERLVTSKLFFVVSQHTNASAKTRRVDAVVMRCANLGIKSSTSICNQDDPMTPTSFSFSADPTSHKQLSPITCKQPSGSESPIVTLEAETNAPHGIVAYQKVGVVSERELRTMVVPMML